MLRKIIKIDREKCNGCSACADACHEGAIVMNNGKAELIRDDYCDGLGDCLPVCPTNAISFEEREAAAYDEEAVKKHLKVKSMQQKSCCEDSYIASALQQWPVQIKLVPVNAPYFQGAKLLVAADCTAYAYGSFHKDFMKEHIVIIGCPKLDSVDYAEKLTDIFRLNDIESIDVVRMEVPCCGGIEYAVQTALQACGKQIPCRVMTISTEGELLA